MAIQRINPETLAAPGGYSHVVRDGNTVYIAGQVARAKDGSTVGVGDPTAQTEQIFRNLQEALASVGCDFSHLLKLNTFMVHREDMAAYRTVRGKYLKDGQLPASTLVFCSGLADPDFRIEVEIIAAIP